MLPGELSKVQVNVLPFNFISAYHRFGLEAFRSTNSVRFVLVNSTGTIFSKSFANRNLSPASVLLNAERSDVEKYFTVGSCFNDVSSR